MDLFAICIRSYVNICITLSAVLIFSVHARTILSAKNNKLAIIKSCSETTEEANNMLKRTPKLYKFLQIDSIYRLLFRPKTSFTLHFSVRKNILVYKTKCLRIKTQSFVIKIYSINLIRPITIIALTETALKSF